MYTSHIDSIPLGDMGESLFVLMMNPYGVDVHAEMIFKDEKVKQDKYDADGKLYSGRYKTGGEQCLLRVNLAVDAERDIWRKGHQCGYH